MPEMGMKGESEIKLFGKTIVVSDPSSSSSSSSSCSSSCSSSSQETKALSIDENRTKANTFAKTSDNQHRPDSSSRDTSKNEQEPSNNSAASQDATTAKKPDKILPCPRCNSVETKFCYYNNYNFNQPRYFCKNCQRYWTSGGSMRNVPVGSGRRKHKTFSIPNYRHAIISDSHPFSMIPNGFLVFGSNVTTTRELSNASNKLRNSGFPIAFYQTNPFWGSTVASDGSNLRKRAREETILRPKKGIHLTSVHVSSYSRIGDSKRINTSCAKNERLFRGLGPRTTTILEANPAALSRSLNFHEAI